MYTWPFSCRGTWSRATDAVPLGIGLHTHVSTQYIVVLSYCCISLVALARKFPHTFWLYMYHSASHAKTHCHTLVLLHASALHICTASIKARKNKAHWHTEHVVFLLVHFFWQTSCDHTNKTYWHSLVFYMHQLYILPCLTKATKAKCTGTKAKSMQCFVYMFFFKAHASIDWAKRIGTVMFYCMPQIYKMHFSTKTWKNTKRWHAEFIQVNTMKPWWDWDDLQGCKSVKSNFCLDGLVRLYQIMQAPWNKKIKFPATFETISTSYKLAYDFFAYSYCYTDLLAVGLSRIARGEVVSFCVPRSILMTFTIFGNSSCIIFAVVRSTLHFFLHSLFFRSYLVSPAIFDGFYHIRQEFMYHFCCCAQYFVAFELSFAFFVPS